MLGKLNRLWYRGLEKLVRQGGKHMRAAMKSSPAGKVVKPKKTPQDAPGAWSAGSFQGAGLAGHLRYRLFLPPAAATNAGGIPLLIMLHGCQQDAARFAAGTGMNRLAAARGFAVVYPEQSPTAHPRRCWKWYEPATQRGEGDIALIAGLTQALAARHAIDRNRIYACGLSAGAAMAQILALSHPGLLAAVGMHSGPVFGACRSAAGALRLMQYGAGDAVKPIDLLLRQRGQAEPMPAILISGADDRVVRPVNAMQLERQFLRLNQAWRPSSRPVVDKPFGRASSKTGRKRSMRIRDYQAGRKLLLRAVEIEGLGHAWSGGDERIPFHAKGPDAGRLMLDFFARHRRADHQRQE